jgi:uncharacterized protein
MSTEAETTDDVPRTAATPGALDPTAGRTAGAVEWASESARAIADPAPLGLAAFALTTFVLSLVNSGLISGGAEPVVFGLALAYGGLGQLLAGMWEFRKGNTFGATAFASYGAFWLSFWALVTFYVRAIPAGDAGTAVGWYLVSWGIFTTIMFLASFRTTTALVALFLLLAATFYFLGFGNLGGSATVVKIGGYLGIVTAAVAWYAALAGVMASTFGRPVLPNPPLNRR